MSLNKIDALNPGETGVGEVQLDLGGNPSGENPSSPMWI